MPLRENPNARVCDVLMQNVINATNADVYICVDVDNFYYKGTQYFYTKNKKEENQEIDMFNFDTMRFHSKAEFIEYQEALDILEPAFKELLGERIKSMIITEPYDVSQDPKLEFLKKNINMGCVPEFMIQQHRKSKMAYEVLCEYEYEHPPYEVIIKSRLDNLIMPQIDWSRFNFMEYDIFVPGIKGPVYFDWSAIGNRRAMHYYLTLYDKLGFTLDRGMAYMAECCGTCIKESDNPNMGTLVCPRCGRNDRIWIGNVTLASEHHVCEMVKEQNLRCGVSPSMTHVYRYNSSREPLNYDFLNGLNLGKVNFKSYAMHNGLTEHKLESK